MSKTKTPAPAVNVAGFSGPHLRAAWHFTSREEARFYLQGVLVQAHRGGVLFSATDGHKLIRVFDKSGAWPWAPAILKPGKAMLDAMKAEKRGARPTVSFALELAKGGALKGRIACKVADRAFDCDVIDGSFPDVTRVIPSKLLYERPRTEPPWIAFDSALLAAFAKARAELDGGRAQNLLMSFACESAPAVVWCDGVPAFGVMMPLRAKDAPVSCAPDWHGPGAMASPKRETKAEPAPVQCKPGFAEGARAPRVNPHTAALRQSRRGVVKAAPAEPKAPRTRLSDAERLKRKQERRGFRQRLRAVLGRGVRLSSLPPKARDAAKARAREPLQRMSLAAIAKAAPRIVAPTAKAKSKSVPGSVPGNVKASPALIFETRHRADLLSGRKLSTIRKKSPHTARFCVGLVVPVESPKGEPIGETTVRKVEIEPTLTPAERKGATRLYGAKAKLVRLTFDRVKAAKPAKRR